jgi:hypothetical protein
VQHVAMVSLSILVSLVVRLDAASESTEVVEPAAPAIAADAEKEAFCRDALTHHVPAAVAEAAKMALGHGFHFDSFQAIPTSASQASSDSPTLVYRIQVMDDQSQAREIRVPASSPGHPLATVTAHWMCWVPAENATAKRADSGASERDSVSR